MNMINCLSCGNAGGWERNCCVFANVVILINLKVCCALTVHFLDAEGMKRAVRS